MTTNTDQGRRPGHIELIGWALDRIICLIFWNRPGPIHH